MKSFGKFAFLLVVILVSACGGGSANIHETDSGLRPARRYLDKLESLITTSDREAYLQSLRGHDGLDLNWEEFWSILHSSTKKDIILAENRETLLGLHSVDCRPSFYKSYIRFVLSNVENGNYIFGKENQCALPVGQELWSAVIQKYFTDSLPRSQCQPAFTWVTRELDSRGAVEAWQVALSLEAIGNLRRSFDRLLDSGSFDIAIVVDESFERKFNWSPVRSNLHLYLLREDSNAQLLDNLSTSFLITFLDFQLERFSEVPIANWLKPILHRVIRMHRGSPIDFLAKLLSLTTVASRLRLPSEGVRYANLLQSLVLEWVGDRSESERRELLMLCLSHLETSLAPAHRLQMLWLSLQLSDLLNAVEHRAYLSNATYQQSEEDVSLPHRVLRQRLRMQYAPISSVGSEARNYCRILMQAGFSDRIVSAANFPSIAGSLDAGCVLIKSADKNISMDEDLRLPLDSLIVLPNQDIEIIARRLSVGMVLNRALFESSDPISAVKSLTLTVEEASQFPIFGFDVSRNPLRGANQ